MPYEWRISTRRLPFKSIRQNNINAKYENINGQKLWSMIKMQIKIHTEWFITIIFISNHGITKVGKPGII